MARRLSLWYQAVGHRRLGWIVGGFIAVTLLLMSGLFTGQVSLHAGEIASRDIYAPRRELNQPLYQQLRQQALASVQPIDAARPSSAPLRRAPGLSTSAPGRMSSPAWRMFSPGCGAL